MARNDLAPNPPGVRLQRVMADAGVASRRDCEAMIERGLVEVNGRIVTRLPVFIDPARDRVVVDGRPLALKASGRAGRPGSTRDDRLYLMLHKPDRVLCTTSDESAPGGARTTVTDLVQHRSGARIYPVGRLDYHSTGLVLLTNDGELADRLTHARYGVPRTYRVTVKGVIREDILADLHRRLGQPDTEPSAAADSPVPDPALRRSAAPSANIRIAREPGPESPNTVLEITLREGRNRQLRAILEQMGCLVRKLTLVGVGPVRLRGVAVGEWRNLTRDEVDDLRAAGGLIAPRPRPKPAPAATTRSAAPRSRAARPSARPAANTRTRGNDRRAAPPARAGKPRRPSGRDRRSRR